MTNKHYYIVAGDGYKKGPFLAREIVTLTHQGHLSDDDSIQDEQGVCFTPNAFGSIGHGQSDQTTVLPPIPPPLPKQLQSKDPHPTALVGSRRVWILIFVLGLLARIMKSWDKKSNSKYRPRIQDQRPFGGRNDFTHEP